MSNTIAVGEKQLHPLFQTVEGGDNEGWVSAGWDPDMIRWGSLDTADRNSGSVDMNGGRGGFQPNSMSIKNKADLKAKYPTRTGNYWSYRFGGPHTGGASFVMGDGSVRFISFNVDQNQFVNACSARDGNPVNLD